jgi:uncharacterized protein YndB with AHSA1/START domain
VRARETVTIRRDPADVFRWVADPERARQWQLGVLDYEVTVATPEVVGTQYRETVGDAAGSVELNGCVTEYDADHVMAFEVTGRGIRVHARYVVTPVADGCLLEVDTDVRIGGRLSFLLAPFARGKVGRQLRTELERLRRLCEAEPR